MKKFILSLLISSLLFSSSVFGFTFAAFAENGTTAVNVQNTTVITQSTAERTDDDPFAESKPSIDKETPTFYYILGGVAGIVIIFAIAGFITSKKKK